MKHATKIVVCGGITVLLEDVMPAKRPPQSTLPHYKPARAATTDKTAHAKGRGAVTQVKVQTKGKGPQKVVTKLVKTAGQKCFVVKK